MNSRFYQVRYVEMKNAGATRVQKINRQKTFFNPVEAINFSEKVNGEFKEIKLCDALDELYERVDNE